MTKSELKQLIRETIEEISAETARRAAQKAANLGRDNQANRFIAAARKKDAAAIGGDPKIRISVDDSKISDGVIERLGKTPEGDFGIEIAVDGVGRYILIDNNPFVTTRGRKSVAVDRPTRMKLIKAFKSMGVNINANKLNVVD